MNSAIGSRAPSGLTGMSMAQANYPSWVQFSIDRSATSNVSVGVKMRNTSNEDMLSGLILVTTDIKDPSAPEGRSPERSEGEWVGSVDSWINRLRRARIWMSPLLPIANEDWTPSDVSNVRRK
jgi:hypothetical protein